MLNRSIQVDLVKTKKQKTDETSDDDVDVIAGIAGIIDNSITKIGIGVAAYVLMDTIRKVVVKSIT